MLDMRTFENRAGQVYDPTDLTRLFAEDINAIVDYINSGVFLEGDFSNEDFTYLFELAGTNYGRAEYRMKALYPRMMFMGDYGGDSGFFEYWLKDENDVYQGQWVQGVGGAFDWVLYNYVQSFNQLTMKFDTGNVLVGTDDDNGSARLQVGGSIYSSDLVGSGNRPVYANSDGILVV